MTADFIDLDAEAAASLQSLIDAAAEAGPKPPTGAERKAALVTLSRLAICSPVIGPLCFTISAICFCLLLKAIFNSPFTTISYFQ